MIKSMTGYGRAVETVNGREFTVELRSVNNRYLDCNVKMPRAISFAEDAVKQAVKAAVSRGKVDVYITMTSEASDDVQVKLNKPVVEGYLAAMRQMVEEYGVKDDISVSVLARMSDVFTVEKPQTDEDQLKADLLGVVHQALTNYNQMRAVEGAALETDLRNRAATILELVAKVEEANPQTVSDYRKQRCFLLPAGEQQILPADLLTGGQIEEEQTLDGVVHKLESGNCPDKSWKVLRNISHFRKVEWVWM